MSCDDNETPYMSDPLDGPTVTLPDRVYREMQGMSIQLLSTLELLTSNDCHCLKVLENEEWVDWPSLEPDIIAWMSTAVSSGDVIRPGRSARFTNREGWLAVTAEHIIDDFWWVECLPTGQDHAGNWIVDAYTGPAAALLRIIGSGRCLPYKAADSPRITSDQ